MAQVGPVSMPLTLVNEPAKPPETLSSITWRHFRKHRLAIAGSIVLALLVLGVIFVPIVT